MTRSDTLRQLLADRVTLARALGGSWMAAELEQKMAAAGETPAEEIR